MHQSIEGATEQPQLTLNLYHLCYLMATLLEMKDVANRNI